MEKKYYKLNILSVILFFIFSLTFTKFLAADTNQGINAEIVIERMRGFKVTPSSLHFGTYKSSQSMPATQSVEVSIINNVVEPAFHINLSCAKGFVNSVSGNVIIGSPQFFISKPTPKNPEDFQQARGTSVYCPQDPAYRGYIGVCSQDYDTGGAGAEIYTSESQGDIGNNIVLIITFIPKVSGYFEYAGEQRQIKTSIPHYAIVSPEPPAGTYHATMTLTMYE